MADGPVMCVLWKAGSDQ